MKNESFDDKDMHIKIRQFVLKNYCSREDTKKNVRYIYIYKRDNNSSERVDSLDPRFPTLAEDLRFGD